MLFPLFSSSFLSTRKQKERKQKTKDRKQKPEVLVPGIKMLITLLNQGVEEEDNIDELPDANLFINEVFFLSFSLSLFLSLFLSFSPGREQETERRMDE